MIPFIESAKDEILAKIDTLKTTIDRLISSSQGNNPNIALGNLSNKIDALKQDVGTKSSQTTVNKVGRDLENIASIITSKIDTVETKTNQTNTTLATKADQNTVDAVASNVNSVLALARQGATKQDIRQVSDVLQVASNNIDRGVIRRIQRGEVRSSQTKNWYTYYDVSENTNNKANAFDIQLPYSVNASKAIVLCSTSVLNNYTTNTNYSYLSCGLAGSNKLRFVEMIWGSTVFYPTHIEWQVIEFY